jgi:hypothetical protein
MNKFLIGLFYLLSLNFELALVLVSAVQGGKYLNKSFPMSVDWMNITIPLSVLLCCFVLFRYLVFIVKSDRKKASDDQK